MASSPVDASRRRQEKRRQLDARRSKCRIRLGGHMEQWCLLKERLGFSLHSQLAKFLLDRLGAGPGRGCAGGRRGCDAQSPTWSVPAASSSPPADFSFQQNSLCDLGPLWVLSPGCWFPANRGPRVWSLQSVGVQRAEASWPGSLPKPPLFPLPLAGTLLHAVCSVQVGRE